MTLDKALKKIGELIAELRDENKRLRAALKKLISEPDMLSYPEKDV
jgi:hypothetical protein